MVKPITLTKPNAICADCRFRIKDEIDLCGAHVKLNPVGGYHTYAYCFIRNAHGNCPDFQRKRLWWRFWR